MKPNIFTILFIVISAIAKAFADTIAWHYDLFVAKFGQGFNTDFWKINVVSKKVTTILSYPVDAWHLSNSLMIFAFLAIPFVYKPKYKWWIDYIIGGGIFIITFNLFYNLIFN